MSDERSEELFPSGPGGAPNGVQVEWYPGLPTPEPAQARLPLIVLVPAYNEEERIGEVVSRLRELSRSLAEIGLDLKVYVIDDGSTDGTLQTARTAGTDRVLRHQTNRGLGAAVRTGLAAARADGAGIVIKFDADLQHDPHDVLQLIRPILTDEADVVYGDRSKGIEYQMPFLRRIGNFCFTRLMRWLTGWPLRDGQPGILALSRVYLEQFFLPGDYNYTQQILLDAYHKGMRFEHVPVTFRKRETGRSFVSLSYPLKALSQMVLVLTGVKPMKVFAPLGLFFLAVACAVFFWELAIWFVGDAVKPVRSVNLVLGTGLFGLQTLFFGLLAELIVRRNRSG
jgi:glycosyltransferase involved in cell wall biosynthesis